MTSTSTFTIPGLLSLVILVGGCTSNPGKTKSEKIDYLVNEAMEDHAFVGNILVADSGRIVYRKSVGNANTGSGILNSDSTKFLIASLSKPFTATLILKLIEQGLVNSNDTLAEFFPTIKNANLKRITIHHLLTHTSGVKELITEDHVVEEQDLNGIDFNFNPGSDFEYSNSGYVLLRKIAEIASGQTYGALLSQHIFTPLQMTSSGVAHDITTIPNLATGYKDATQREPDTITFALEIVDGAGSLFSTSDDLLKFSEGLHSEKFLSKVLRDIMFHQHVSGKYGYGWFLRERSGVWDVAYHKGDLPGYTSFMSRKITTHQTIILLCNAGGLDPGDLENDIARILKVKE